MFLKNTRLVKKYMPLVIVVYFCTTGLFIAYILGSIKVFFDGGSVFDLLEGHLFLALVAFIVGVIFCEIRTCIKSRFRASLLFGILSGQIYFGCFFVSSIIFEGVFKEIPFNYYLIVTLILSAGMSVIYVGVERK